MLLGNNVIVIGVVYVILATLLRATLGIAVILIAIDIVIDILVVVVH